MKDKKATPAAASSFRTFFTKKHVVANDLTDTSDVVLDDSREDEVLAVEAYTNEVFSSGFGSSTKAQSSTPIFSIFSPKIAKTECNVDKVEGD